MVTITHWDTSRIEIVPQGGDCDRHQAFGYTQPAIHPHRHLWPCWSDVPPVVRRGLLHGIH